MMIENFCLITAKENLIKPKITPNVGYSLFEFATDEEYKEYVNHNPQGLRWDFAGKEIKLFERPLSLYGLPSPDLQRVVVIYPFNHPVYSEPRNAVIYNADGSIHLQLVAPKLISPMAKQRERFMNYEAPLKLYFDRVRWAKNNKEEIVTAVQIGFDRDWLEERELNPETGEFGKCLSSGRR
jgi:hypothetical protein